MNGHVDGQGRALVALLIQYSDQSPVHVIEAWIDTGFNGDLVLSQHRIDELSLPPAGTLKARLADGSEVALQRYTCLIDWFGQTRELEVVANDGEYALLGIGLLAGYDLQISFRTASVSIH